MKERRDDTTKSETESRAEREPNRSYYYDDSTGYEIYKSEEEGDREGSGEDERIEGSADEE